MVISRVISAEFGDLMIMGIRNNCFFAALRVR